MNTTVPSGPTGYTNPLPGDAGPAAAPRPAVRPGRWRQRWYRMVVPLAVAAVLIVVTLVARALEEPDLAAATTLDPGSTVQDGSRALADLLAERGVTVTHVTDPETAFDRVQSAPDAVLFVAKPSLMGGALVAVAAGNPGIHRAVLVMPSNLHLLATGLPVVQGGQRWATGAAEPGCAVPEAVAAGRAAVVRNRYLPLQPELGQSCYDGGLLRLTDADRDVFVVGGADPFLNRRLTEHGNAALALGLLGGHREVIWVDALPVEPDLEWPSGLELPPLRAPERSELDRSGGGNPLAALLAGYPPGVAAGLLLALLLAVLVAVVRARRLGPPVAEPLPVVVPATEVVSGRGRLYQVTRARPVALRALREAALRRILPALGLPSAPPPSPEAVVAAAAERTGLPPERLRQALYEGTPHTDDQFTDAVAALDALVELLTRDNPAAEGGAS